MTYKVREGKYLVSSDRSLLDVDRIHAFLTRSYWAEGVTQEAVALSIENSIPFGVYQGEEQVGFTRVITDLVSLAYVAEVYVEQGHRGKGLGKLLIHSVMGHPELRNVRRWLLGTRDAHGLYSQFGFAALHRPERWMERSSPDLYKHE